MAAEADYYFAAGDLVNWGRNLDAAGQILQQRGKQVYVIDWEYAGNNDPMWDLGDVSVEAAFGPDQDEALLRAYFDGAPPK